MRKTLDDDSVKEELQLIAKSFWIRHRGVLERNGCGHDDVQQQAQLEWCRLRITWDVNGTHYVKERLIDWMRDITQWHRTTGSSPLVYEYNVRYDSRTIEIGPELEAREIAEKARMMLGKTHDLRMLNILNNMLVGYTKTAIAHSLGVSLSLVSLLYTQFIDEMRQQLNIV